MKKLTVLLVLFALSANGQTPDTIFANEHHNVALFFPEKIRQAVVGAENFVFSYNQEHPQYFGLLKGSTGKSTNLLAVTLDGQIYSYILKYSTELPKVTYFIDKRESIGNEQPATVKEEQTPIRSIYSNDSIQRNNYLEKLSAYYCSISKGNLKHKRTNGIVLQVNDVFYNQNDLFIIFEIINKSTIEFEPEFLRLFLSTGNRQRNSSYQKLLQQPLYTYKFPETVLPGQRKRFVCVFPKFTLGQNEKIILELREKRGNRLVKLKL
ncbi:DUF4138 domain-containing protein [Salinimicrobium sp. MT39]|uniref:DUF4138 domain-containing protein n=1 Tax=Salinimicrobium profundisediminis TaxID=2994553 RepID=A0A9X3CYY6_9FLAO|nr:DUF4138 domain-containing protein [Salinimicrobium profundisediminis]MCX2839082.1 DUF4138 domain-containing protein [Salinimicrobium profundisediminis]